ncbi:helix-turn-helix transcriptional regulator [Desulfovibrio sp. UCD-KL4C]|uniref:helix-turn-helix domain-containing protein n=1 Tax=Desulfovibrio sp. UCD-KL4C TaxID=2578120 RepID=UPI0025C2D376|nr:helix-turn-helix transcriptional regulator [Desulfovibrio sp. UCD-KL4C]
MSDLQNVFGEHLKSLRKSKGLTQDELVELCGLSVQYLGDVERGKANATINVLGKIGQALGVSTAELFDTAEFQVSTEDLREQLRTYISRADSETLRQLYAITRIISR